MGFGTAVVYDYENDLYHFFGPKQKQQLIDLLKGNFVVSFNGIRFDNRVLLGNDYQERDHLWEDFDLLLEVVRSKFGVDSVEEAEERYGAKQVHDGSIGLNGLAEGTLGLKKTGHGSKAPQMIREGKWADVFAYNLNDVRLTRLLYEFAERYGYLIDKSGRKIPIGMP